MATLTAAKAGTRKKTAPKPITARRLNEVRASVNVLRKPKQRRELPSDVLEKFVEAIREQLDGSFTMARVHAHHMTDFIKVDDQPVPTIVADEGRSFFLSPGGDVLYNVAQGLPVAVRQQMDRERRERGKPQRLELAGDDD